MDQNNHFQHQKVRIIEEGNRSSAVPVQILIKNGMPAHRQEPSMSAFQNCASRQGFVNYGQ